MKNNNKLKCAFLNQLSQSYLSRAKQTIFYRFCFFLSTRLSEPPAESVCTVWFGSVIAKYKYVHLFSRFMIMPKCCTYIQIPSFLHLQFMQLLTFPFFVVSSVQFDLNVRRIRVKCNLRMERKEGYSIKPKFIGFNIHGSSQDLFVFQDNISLR